MWVLSVRVCLPWSYFSHSQRRAVFINTASSVSIAPTALRPITASVSVPITPTPCVLPVPSASPPPATTEGAVPRRPMPCVLSAPRAITAPLGRVPMTQTQCVARPASTPATAAARRAPSVPVDRLRSSRARLTQTRSVPRARPLCPLALSGAVIAPGSAVYCLCATAMRARQPSRLT